MLASPYWQALASATPSADRAAFTEITRRLRESGEEHSNIWPTHRHPLRYWSDHLQYEKRCREYAENPPRYAAEPARSQAGL